MKRAGYVFKTLEKYRKKKAQRHRPEDITGLGKRILKYLVGGGMVIWFDVTSIRIGGGCKRGWVHRSNLAKTGADMRQDLPEYDLMCSYALGAGILSMTISENCDWSV